MERVSVDSIDHDDRTFCISYPILDDRLVASIKQFGVVSPLILLGPAPFRVLTGHRRLEAARLLGVSEVPCHIEAMDERSALLLAINHNIFRPLNIVEKALCIEKMMGADLAKEQFGAAMKIMELQAHDKIIRLFLALAKADEGFKAFAVKHNMATHELGLLFSFPFEIRSALVAALAPIHLTSSLVREIVELARLLYIKRGSIPFEDLEGLTKGDEVKAALKGKAYPLLTDMKERLKAIKDAMGLPPRITLATDPYFERSGVEIRIAARNEGEVQESITKLQLVRDNGHIRRIFDLFSSDPDRN